MSPIPPFRTRRAAAAAGAGGGAGLTPDEVSGLIFWFDAAAGNVYSDSSLSTLSADTERVRGWTDLARGDDMSQAFASTSHTEFHTSGFGPESLPYVEFKDSTYSILRTAGTYSMPANGTTVIAMYQHARTGGEIGFMFNQSTIGNGVYAAHEGASATGPGYYDGTHTNFGIGSVVGDAGVYSWRHQADKSRFYDGTTLLGSSAGAASFSTGAGQIALGGGPTWALFDLAMIAVYDNDISDEDFEGVVAGFEALGGF